MIKYLNDGEINFLKRGFYNTLALKKIQLLDFENSAFNGELTISSITENLDYLESKNFPLYKSYFFSKLHKNLEKFELFSEEEYRSITKAFLCCTDDGEIEDSYYEYDIERHDFINTFLENLCLEYNLKLHSESYQDLFSGDDQYFNLSLFGEIRDSLRSYFSTNTSSLSEEDLREEYNSNFQEDATCYVIEGVELSKSEVFLLDELFSESVPNVESEVYTDNGNTYIIISDYHVISGFVFVFFVYLKLIFKSKFNEA